MLDCWIVGCTSEFIFIAFNPSLQWLLPYIHICYHGLLFTTVWCISLGSEIDNIQYTISRNENFSRIFIFWLNCHRIPVILVQCVVLWFIGGRKKSSSDGSDQLNTVRRGTCFRSTNLYSSTILPPPPLAVSWKFQQFKLISNRLHNYDSPDEPKQGNLFLGVHFPPTTNPSFLSISKKFNPPPRVRVTGYSSHIRHSVCRVRIAHILTDGSLPDLGSW